MDAVWPPQTKKDRDVPQPYALTGDGISALLCCPSSSAHYRSQCAHALDVALPLSHMAGHLETSTVRGPKELARRPRHAVAVQNRGRVGEADPEHTCLAALTQASPITPSCTLYRLLSAPTPRLSSQNTRPRPSEACRLSTILTPYSSKGGQEADEAVFTCVLNGHGAGERSVALLCRDSII
jgi:hypothetical protein